MNKELIKERIADILKDDCCGMEPEYTETEDGKIIVNTKVYALQASKAANIAALANEADRICIFTINSIQKPTIEIHLVR